MGRGDKKTRRGKIVNRSYGVRRPRKSKTDSPVIQEKEVKKTTKAKAKAKPKAAPKAASAETTKPKKAATTTTKAKKTKKEETPEE